MLLAATAELRAALLAGRRAASSTETSAGNGAGDHSSPSSSSSSSAAGIAAVLRAALGGAPDLAQMDERALTAAIADRVIENGMAAVVEDVLDMKEGIPAAEALARSAMARDGGVGGAGEGSEGGEPSDSAAAAPGDSSSVSDALGASGDAGDGSNSASADGESAKRAQVLALWKRAGLASLLAINEKSNRVDHDKLNEDAFGRIARSMHLVTEHASEAQGTSASAVQVTDMLDEIVLQGTQRFLTALSKKDSKLLDDLILLVPQRKTSIAARLELNALENAEERGKPADRVETLMEAIYDIMPQREFQFTISNAKKKVCVVWRCFSFLE
jgi:hypothetical protein